MDGLTVLIAAFAEEDQRLKELVASFPPACRNLAPAPFKYSLEQTLVHLAFWDDRAVRHFESICHRGSDRKFSLAEFETRHREQLAAMRTEAWESVLETYRQTTRALLKLLTEHWSDLDGASRESFKIPLKHRRYHRRKLESMLAEFVPSTASGRCEEQQA